MYLSFTAKQYRSILDAARRNFDFHIRAAKYNTRIFQSTKWTNEELIEAARDRKLIASVKKDLAAAIARENSGNLAPVWLGVGHDPSGEQY